jgi:hypothetical protein
VSVRDEVEQLEDAIRSANPAELVRALRRVHPEVNWPGPNRSPRIGIDLWKLERLGAYYVTVGEAAHVLGVSRSTLTRRLREPEYRRAWNRGRVSVKIAVRRKQLEVALEGSDTMLIWLGKQLLGQTDGPVVEPVRVREPGFLTINLKEFDEALDELLAELMEDDLDGG